MSQPTTGTLQERRAARAAGERGQRKLLQYLATGSMVGAFMQQSGPLFLLALGAGPFLIGLLAAATSFGNTSRLMGVKLMPRLGKPRLMGTARLASALFLLLLVPLALYAGPGIAWAALALLVLRQSMVQVGGSAWWPLVQDNTPKSAQVSFITRMRMTQRLCTLGVPLLAGWYLGAQPDASRFALPFGLGLVLVVAGSMVVLRVPEKPLPRPREGLWKRLAEVLKEPAMRRYCTCFAVTCFVETAILPFWVVALTGRGLPVNYYVWMLSLMGAGELLTLYLWGRLVERHGSRPALTASLLGMAALGGAWLLLPVQTAPLTAWAAVYFLVWGMLHAGYTFGQTRAMMDAVPQGYQGEGFAVPNFVLAWASGLGGFAGGLLFDRMSTLELESSTVAATHWYLAGTQLLFAAGWLASRRLVGRDLQTPMKELMQRAVRRRRRIRE